MMTIKLTTFCDFNKNCPENKITITKHGQFDYYWVVAIPNEDLFDEVWNFFKKYEKSESCFYITESKSCFYITEKRFAEFILKFA